MQIILANKSHILPCSKILVQAYYDSLADAKSTLSLKINSKECFVAIDNREVVGVLIYARNYSHYANYIEDITVSKKHRRKGIALSLLKKYVEVSRKETPKKQKYALSSTHVGNKISIAMHKKAGFKVIGILKALHYGKDELMFGFEL